MKGFCFLVCCFFCAVAAYSQPVISSEPQSLTVNAGSTASFTVTVRGTNAGLKYQWLVNGTNLADGASVMGSATSNLMVSPVAPTDAGAYTVIISSTSGSTSNQSPAQLTVVQGTIVDFQVSGFAGGASNLVVELFDHDKPATVENFIHYITSGAYSNMFFDRLIPGFVIQGGDWSTSNETSTVPGLSLVGNGIFNYYVTGNVVTNPPLPVQVDSEYLYGPLVSNTFGTLAMALQANNQDSASSAFFINLGDNTTNLAEQDGGFTVFGRVMSENNLMIGGVPLVNAGTNLLNYFNNTNAFNSPDAGLYTTDPYFTGLPVNYIGTNEPANDNLFYIGFTFLSNSVAGLSGPAQPPVDNIPPTATITSPSPDQLLTNGSPLVVEGTASDNVGLALVECILVPLNGANGSQPIAAIATGTTNWSLDFAVQYGSIPPGTYEVEAVAQDGAGNTNTPASEQIEITAIVTNGAGSVTVTNAATGAFFTNGVAAALENGLSYVATAVPAPGQEFLNWSGPNGVSINPSVSFVMTNNLVLTATFSANGIPGAVAFTFPPPTAQLLSNDFTFTGTISTIPWAQLTFQLFAQTNGSPIGQSVTNYATNVWAMPVTNLAVLQPGEYIIQVTAYDPEGQSTVISEAFTVTMPGLLPMLTSEPQGLTINAGSTATFTVGATNSSGGLTYQWELNGVNLSDGGEISGSATATLTVSPAALSDAGAYTLIVGSQYGSVTSQPAQLNVLQGTIINFKLSGFSGGPSNMVVELFDHDKPATVENFIHYVTSGAYTNMFFDRLVPGFVLQGGDWSTPDRTNSVPPVSVVGNGIYGVYVTDQLVNNPPLPEQVDSEFNVGPFISNKYGTLAMALKANEQDSAANAFFINLADNSSVLDTESGGFTVFGIVMNTSDLTIAGATITNAGTNLLNYFNNTNFFSAPTNGLYTANPAFASLPVNFAGTNTPADTSLFYVDFTFLTNSAQGVAGPAQPIVNTNSPVVAITYPTSGQVLTNGSPLVAQGTASDGIGLARVYSFLQPQNGSSAGTPFGNNASGTTNWSLNYVAEFGDISPGKYVIDAVSQNGAGYVSSVGKIPFTVTAVVINGSGSVQLIDIADNASTTDVIGYPLTNGVQYIARANPAAGQTFINWTGAGNVSISSSVVFQMSSGLLLTANFIPNDSPAALAITYPPAKGQLTNSNFAVSGTVTGVDSAQITCTLFSETTRNSVGQPFTFGGTNTWSAPVTNLASLEPGKYILQAIAYDSQGRSAVVTNGFTVMAKLNLTTNGAGTISLSPGANPAFPYLVPGSYTAKAVARPGSVFYNWSNGANVSINPSETLSLTTNASLTATFVSNDLPTGLSFSYPAANAKLKQPASLPAIVATGKAPASATNVTYQLFSQASKLAVGPAVSISPSPSGSGQGWSVPMTNLAPGNYTAVAVANDSQGRTALITENFDVLGQLTVQTQGAGSYSPTSLNGQFLVVGQQYSIRATPSAGWLFESWSGSAGSSANPALTFTMTSNLVLTATFATNYFPGVQGEYYGLYYPNIAVNATNSDDSGYVAMKVTSSGTFTGTLSLYGHPLTLGGAFRADGTEELIGQVEGVDIFLALHIDLTNGTETLTGLITNTTTALAINWTAALQAYRGVTSLSAVTNFGGVATSPKFVLTIPGDTTATSAPPGSGYASMSITPAGMVNVAGLLADNTSFSQSVGISRQGIWPFYVSLYKYQGVIFGWQTNTSPSNFTGSLNWYKPNAGGIYYPAGFSVTPGSSANSYAPPAPGSQYVMILGGGTLTEPLTNSLTVSSRGQFVPASATDKLQVSLTTTGVLSGQFLNPATGKIVQLKGAFANPATGGSGFTLDSDGKTGYVQIQKATASLQ